MATQGVVDVTCLLDGPGTAMFRALVGATSQNKGSDLPEDLLEP